MKKTSCLTTETSGAKSFWRIVLLLLGLVTLTIISSCDKNDDEIYNIRADMEQLQNQCDELRKAYETGKIIKSVVPLVSSEKAGYQITFSDDSTIKLLSWIKDESDSEGNNLYLRTNISNCWEFSYNYGKTFDLLVGSDGNPVRAIDNQDATGENGANIAGGYSVRVLADVDGYYIIEIYNIFNEVTDTIVTTYNSSPPKIVQSIVENSITGRIIITMESGDIYEFEKIIYPINIIILNREISINHNGEETLEFRVNPSNAYLNPKDISLDLVRAGTCANEYSYITKPVNYVLQSVDNARDENGVIKRGQYVASIKDLEVSPDYCDDVAIVISSCDANGDEIKISSELIKISAKQPSSLPKVYITTPNGVGITSKQEWVTDGNIRIIDENGNENLNVSSSFKGRGNSTWDMPKKPYAIKLDSKAKVLGMPKHKRWVLLANWKDRTLMRNAVAFEMARSCMDWAPRGRFVELYLNGKHQGNYYLCEQIKIDKDRVNVDKIEEDFSEDNLSGGYLLEFDKSAPQEINYFYTKHRKLPVTIKEPDEEVIVSWDHPAFIYIKEYVDSVETFFETNAYELVKDKIDVQSYIDWLLIHELASNFYEPLHPKSCYMYKARNGKLYAGPVWDFDWGTFRPTEGGLQLQDAMWYIYMFKNNEFKRTLKKRWHELKPKFEEIEGFIKDQAVLIKESNEVNIIKWPITNTSTNGDENMSFDEAIERMISAYTSRIAAVDADINEL